MGKVSVIIYITVALLILFLIAQTPNKSTHRDNHHRHRRLKLRSNFSFVQPTTSAASNVEHRIPFDPLVADIERKREDKLWEKTHFFDEHTHGNGLQADEEAPGMERQPEWEDFMDAEDYLNDEEKFNITHRLILLFPRIDNDPPDGFVTEHELTEWNLEQARRDALHRSKREMELHDKVHRGFISFAEYQPPSWVRSNFTKQDNDSSDHDMGWWKEEHFNASDADGDGVLNVTEFHDFQHPADSNNPKLILWLCKEEVRERDTDKDGKLNFKEFFHGLFDLVRNYDEDGHNYSHEFSSESPARRLFSQLDKDGDGYLSDAELLPVIGSIHPSERYYAKQQADYIISQADKDKDGRLSLEEMIDSPYVFYSAIFNDEEDEEDYDYHDEFR